MAVCTASSAHNLSIAIRKIGMILSKPLSATSSTILACCYWPFSIIGQTWIQEILSHQGFLTLILNLLGAHSSNYQMESWNHVVEYDLPHPLSFLNIAQAPWPPQVHLLKNCRLARPSTSWYNGCQSNLCRPYSRIVIRATTHQEVLCWPEAALLPQSLLSEMSPVVDSSETCRLSVSESQNALLVNWS